MHSHTLHSNTALATIEHPIHPAAQIFPLMAEAELADLAQDIATNGLREPILVDEAGHVLDGRNRLMACRQAGIKPRFQTWAGDGASPVALVLSLNLHRRHLTESQRALVGARIKPLFEAEAKARQQASQARPGQKVGKVQANLPAPNQRGQSRDAAARAVNISPRSVESASRILREGAPALMRAVEDGLVAIGDAAAILDLPSEEQAALVDDVQAGRHRTLRRAAVARRHQARQTPPDDLPALDARCQLLTADVARLADQLAPGSIDCILCDPPYPRSFLPVYADLARTAARVLKPGGSCLVMVGQSYLPEIIAALTTHLRYHWTVAYLTPGGQATQLWERRVNTFWKPVLWFVNDPPDAPPWAGDWVGDVARSDPNDNDKRFHPWGQSESGIADLVRRFTAAGETVLDPFLGGGTTGVVTLHQGRRFIGADIDAGAVETARTRLAALALEVAHAG